jgi:SAM-dependent methyltransferase
MKNMYRVTRPAWAEMEAWETSMILVASLLLGIYGAWGEQFAVTILGLFRVPEGKLHHIWPLIDVLVVTFGCLLLIRCYKMLRIGCYPRTFLYGFYLPEASNPSGRSQVVGFCHIKPDMRTGEIIVEGASFFWDNGQLNINSRVGFKSTQVRGTEDDGETTCHIRFNINSEDSEKRLYRHGLLQFRIANCNVANDDGDVYAGYLESTQTKSEMQDIGVRSQGYAELYSKGRLVESDVQAALARRGNVIFVGLDALLKSIPQPTLWTAKDHMYSNKTNYWGHQIPTPQSVILNEELYPHIEKLLSNVLALIGLSKGAIERFKTLACEQARINKDDTLVAYERELKAGLIGQKVGYMESDALAHRADVIYSEIEPFLCGDSLLDIGCGNGLISNLAKGRFKHIQLLDVVQYVPRALNLAFTLYTEGHPLPIEESFDTVLVLTVLHHSNDPIELLKLAWEATRKRLIIIESVVGVHNVRPPVKFELAKLDDDKQIAYAAFVDWFYNRVLHDNVPVPYNFTTPENWQSTFVKHNMRLAQTIHLGQDIDIGPEYHILFVLDK